MSQRDRNVQFVANEQACFVDLSHAHSAVAGYANDVLTASTRYANYVLAGGGNTFMFFFLKILKNHVFLKKNTGYFCLHAHLHTIQILKPGSFAISTLSENYPYPSYTLMW